MVKYVMSLDDFIDLYIHNLYKRIFLKWFIFHKVSSLIHFYFREGDRYKKAYAIYKKKDAINAT
jgi:hypothetical protein